MIIVGIDREVRKPQADIAAVARRQGDASVTGAAAPCIGKRAALGHLSDAVPEIEL